MRILQLVQRPQLRGAEVFARTLSRELERRGHDVATLYLYPAPEGAERLPFGPRDRTLGGLAEKPSERLPGFDRSLLRRLLAELDRFSPDVVQLNGARTVKYGALARWRRPRAPWALVYRSIGNPKHWLPSPWRRFLYRTLVVSRMDGIVAVSHATAAALKRAYRPRAPVRRIPRAIDPAALVPRTTRLAVRQELDTAPSAPVLVYLGHLAPEKRLDRALRLVRSLRADHPDLVLWLIGAGPERERLARLAEQLDIASNLRFAGERSAVASYLAAADLLVLTSDTEGLPGVVLEAASVGVPSIATRVGGAPECIEDGRTGYLVAPDDEAGLARAVRELVADPAKRRALGDEAARLVHRDFGIGSIADRYEDFYRELVTGGARRVEPAGGAEAAS